MGVGSGEQEDCGPPWVFKHGTNIVDKGLKVLFFGSFLLFFGLFSVGPPWKFFCRRPCILVHNSLYLLVREINSIKDR